MDTGRGTVWQIEMPTAALNAFRGRYLETGLLREGGQVRVRIVADTAPEAGAYSVEPNLEDAYIRLMREDDHATA
jgi:ABC-2 type transport system ATP-binding protein